MTIRARQRGDPGERILEAARRLFAARGPEAVTVAEVARAAGVARATVFNRFGSKRALVEAITAQVLARYGELLEMALADPEASSVALVRGLFDTMGRGIEEDRRLYRLVFREIANLSLGLEEGGLGQRAREANMEGLVRLFSRGQARGELYRDHRPEDLASAMDGLVFGTITHWLYDDASEPLHERMARAAEILLRPVATDPDHAYRPPVLVLPARPSGRRPTARAKPGRRRS